jgi:hypothetical protein
MAVERDGPQGMPCGRIVTALRADALMAPEVDAHYAFDSLAQKGGLAGSL